MRGHRAYALLDHPLVLTQCCLCLVDFDDISYHAENKMALIGVRWPMIAARLGGLPEFRESTQERKGGMLSSLKYRADPNGCGLSLHACYPMHAVSAFYFARCILPRLASCWAGMSLPSPNHAFCPYTTPHRLSHEIDPGAIQGAAHLFIRRGDAGISDRQGGGVTRSIRG